MCLAPCGWKLHVSLLECRNDLIRLKRYHPRHENPEDKASAGIRQQSEKVRPGKLKAELGEDLGTLFAA